MKVKTASAFLFDAFFFHMMPTDATVTVNLDMLYATHFAKIISPVLDKR